MINVLIPFGGKSQFFKESFFPKPLIEINGRTMLEYVIDNYASISDKRFIFIFNKEDCLKFHIDSAAKMLTEDPTNVIVLNGETKGALCTCLMAIDYINNDDPLIIANYDQVIDIDINEIVSGFKKSSVDCGVITFENIHPRWSYIRLDNDEVVEVAEKKPISKHAIAGFYWYSRGLDFVDAAQKTILKDNDLDGRFYISASLNEMILKNKSVGYHEIGRSDYHSFYSPDKIKEFEESMVKNENR